MVKDILLYKHKKRFIALNDYFPYERFSDFIQENSRNPTVVFIKFSVTFKKVAFFLLTFISEVDIFVSTADISADDRWGTHMQQQPLTEGVYYILLALYEPRHGYGIMQFTEEISNGRVRLGAGTIYGAIKTLVEKGWIEALGGNDRKKEYIITDLGKEIVTSELERLKELMMNGEKIVGK